MNTIDKKKLKELINTNLSNEDTDELSKEVIKKVKE